MSDPATAAVIEATNPVVDALEEAIDEKFIDDQLGPSLSRGDGLVPAAVEPETPAEAVEPEVETPAEPEVVAPVPTPVTPAPAPVAAKPEPTPPAAPAPAVADPADPADPTAELKIRLETQKRLRGELVALKAEMAKDDFDAINGAATVAKAVSGLIEALAIQDEAIDNLNGHVSTEKQAKEYTNYWAKWDGENAEIGGGVGKQEWEKILAVANKKYPNATADAIGLLANEKFEERVAQLKGEKKPAIEPTPVPAKPVAAAPVPAKKPATPTPTITKGGAKATPAAPPHRPPQPERSLDERIAAGEFDMDAMMNL